MDLYILEELALRKELIKRYYNDLLAGHFSVKKYSNLLQESFTSKAL